MKKVYKYVLPTPKCEVAMPKGAQILSVIMQDGEPKVYALVDTERPDTLRKFKVFGTGFETDVIGYTFLGTITQGTWVWHVFYETE